MGPTPVQEIEIKAVGLEPLQAALAGRHRALARRIVGIDLAHEVDAIAQAAHRLPDNLLGHPLAVHFGRVDQSHSELKSQLERPHFRAPLRFALPHTPRAKPKYRHPCTALERHRSHLQLLCFGAAITPPQALPFRAPYPGARNSNSPKDGTGLALN